MGAARLQAGRQPKKKVSNGKWYKKEDHLPGGPYPKVRDLVPARAFQ
jgi:hypothetical protein